MLRVWIRRGVGALGVDEGKGVSEFWMRGMDGKGMDEGKGDICGVKMRKRTVFTVRGKGMPVEGVRKKGMSVWMRVTGGLNEGRGVTEVWMKGGGEIYYT